LGLIFAPLNVAAFMYTPRHLRGAAVGLLALLRNEGGSVGTSMAQTIQERREQFHLSRLGEFLDPFNPAVTSFLEQARAFFYQQSGDAAGSQQKALRWPISAAANRWPTSASSGWRRFWGRCSCSWCCS
jgi:DHA2 family multidrug resistance protein